MSETRPRKRQAPGPSEEVSPILTTTTRPNHHHQLSLPTFKPTFVSQQQLEMLQAELDHERNLRLLDQKKAAQGHQRMERQLELAVEQAKEATQLLDEVQTESERSTRQLRQARNQALEQLRHCQMELEEHEEPDDSSEQYWQEQCRHLEAKLEAARTAEEATRTEMEQIRNDLEEKWEKQREEQFKSPVKLPPSVEDAPPAVLKELNKTRLLLHDTDRQCRQLQRAKDELKLQNHSLIQEREQGRMALRRLPVIESELSQLRRTNEETLAAIQLWKELGESIQQVMASSLSGPVDAKVEGPPEPATLTFFLIQSKARFDTLEENKKLLEQENKKLRASVAPLEATIKDMERSKRHAELDMKERSDQLSSAQRSIGTITIQNGLYQREITNLKALIRTYDELPLASSKDEGGSGNFDTSQDTLRLSFDAAKREMDAYKRDCREASKDLEAAVLVRQELERELERVKDKFGKLKVALLTEREKVSSAEQRALDAERLAGKGSFNPDETRVLHLKESPLVQALRDEVEVLQRQLEAAKGERPTKRGPDPEKLNQRLKENFKEQISHFREGVYLMTGYKVDMLPGMDRPTFRVRSVYAEKEEDHLMFKWPVGEQVASLDILNTDLAKALATTPSYDYMSKFHSLPAFLASIQLSLFEKQTVML